MICPKCQTELPEGAKFCLECGHGLTADKFVPQPHPAPEPERKIVTVLFSDLTGYTALTERLDPEQVKEITGEVFAGVKGIISKYEGFIDRLLGDGCLAFFGIPRAHEDDPIRAIRAAMETHDLVKALSPKYKGRVGASLTMHTGINTGLVVTAEVDPEKGSQGVAGDAVNLAARLSGLAGPGEILAGEETVRRTRGRFEFRNLGAKRVKGKAEPVSVYKLISGKAVAPTSDRQVSSAMVGRDRELNRLELQVMKVISGEGSVVHIIGEAGIGKSRLLAELRQREVMKKVILLEGRAISIGRNLSFHPLIDLLKQWSVISEVDSEDTAFGKLERTIRTIHPEEAGRRIKESRPPGLPISHRCYCPFLRLRPRQWFSAGRCRKQIKSWIRLIRLLQKLISSPCIWVTFSKARLHWIWPALFKPCGRVKKPINHGLGGRRPNGLDAL